MRHSAALDALPTRSACYMHASHRLRARLLQQRRQTTTSGHAPAAAGAAGRRCRLRGAGPLGRADLQPDALPEHVCRRAGRAGACRTPCSAREAAMFGWGHWGACARLNR